MNAIDFIESVINHSENMLSIIDKFTDNECKFTDNELKSEFCMYLKKKYKIKIERWEPNKAEYPEYMFLDSDRGILAYVKFNVYIKDSIDIEKDITYDLNEIITVVSRIESELDRPTFFINFICSYNKSNNKYYVDLDCTGDLKELIKVFTNLKKDKVIIY